MGCSSYSSDHQPWFTNFESLELSQVRCWRIAWCCCKWCAACSLGNINDSTLWVDVRFRADGIPQRKMIKKSWSRSADSNTLWDNRPLLFHDDEPTSVDIISLTLHWNRYNNGPRLTDLVPRVTVTRVRLRLVFRSHVGAADLQSFADVMATYIPVSWVLLGALVTPPPGSVFQWKALSLLTSLSSSSSSGGGVRQFQQQQPQPSCDAAPSRCYLMVRMWLEYNRNGLGQALRCMLKNCIGGAVSYVIHHQSLGRYQRGPIGLIIHRRAVNYWDVHNFCSESIYWLLNCDLSATRGSNSHAVKRSVTLRDCVRAICKHRTRHEWWDGWFQ